MQRENLLRDWFEIIESYGQASSFHGIVSQEELGRKRGRNVATTLHQLEKSGLAERQGHGWCLTKPGLKEAHRVTRNHRLWEMFLMYETSLGAISVDRDADTVEHFLPPEALAQLEAMLKKNQLEPKLNF